MKSDELIQKQKPISQSRWHGKVMFPIMEKELYKRFINTRKEEKQIKRLSFNTKAKRIMCEISWACLNHQNVCQMAYRIFQQLCKSISKLHAKTLREGESKAHILQGTLPISIKYCCHLFLMIIKPKTRKG